MLKIFKYLFIFCFILFISSCYKDLGNYNYKDINNITVISDSFNYSLKQQDTLRIKVSLQETMTPGEKTYKWVLYPNTGVPLTRRTLGESKDLNAVISENPGTYKLDYFVTDKTTGVAFHKEFSVVVVSAFSEGWLVLEEKESNVDLALIAPTGDVFRNIYTTTNNGNYLPKGSNKIMLWDNRNDQEIYIASPDDMIQVNFVNFLKISDFRNLFFDAPTPTKVQAFSFDGGMQKCLINNGQVFSYSTMVPPPYFFGLAVSGIGEYYMEPYKSYSAYGYIFYERTKQRFYQLGSYDINFVSFPEYKPGVDSFNFNNVGKKLMFGGEAVGPASNFLFKNNNDDSLFVYNVNPSAQVKATGKYNVTGSEGLVDAKVFVMSKTLNFIYYAYENKIYKLDIFAGKGIPIYTFPASASVVEMRLLGNRMVIATNEGNQGKVNFFNVELTGNFENNTYTHEYKGFNKINGIGYKTKK